MVKRAHWKWLVQQVDSAVTFLLGQYTSFAEYSLLGNREFGGKKRQDACKTSDCGVSFKKQCA